MSKVSCAAAGKNRRFLCEWACLNCYWHTAGERSVAQIATEADRAMLPVVAAESRDIPRSVQSCVEQYMNRHIQIVI